MNHSDTIINVENIIMCDYCYSINVLNKQHGLSDLCDYNKTGFT